MPGAAHGNPIRTDVDELLMPTDEDLLYEEELLRNPYSLRMWQRYIEARRSIDAKRRYILYERALRVLPGSYKLWHAYLQERRLAARGAHLADPQLGKLNGTYERALVSMHKMPRVWTEVSCAWLAVASLFRGTAACPMFGCGNTFCDIWGCSNL